jgi:hypothetical protein
MGMFKKILSVYISLILLLGGMIPVNSSYAQAKKEYTIAILDLAAKGVSQVEAEVLSEKLRSHISDLITSKRYTSLQGKDKYLVVEQTQVDKILEQFEIQNTGCVSDSCAIEFGKMLQVDRIVLGQIGLVGNTYLVSARIIDVGSRKAIATANRQYKGSIDELMTSVIMEVGDNLMLGPMKKKSKTMWYLVGGAVLAGAGAAASLGGKGKGEEVILLPSPPDRPK